MLIIFYCFIVAKKGSKASIPGSSCKDILASGDSQGNGGYWIDPTDSGNPFPVYCDMNTDRGNVLYSREILNGIDRLQVWRRFYQSETFR